MERKFLIILCSNVGDAVCATPAIKLLREYCPNAQIDVLISSEQSRQVVLHNPCINRLISADGIEDIKQFGLAYNDVLVFMAAAKERDIAKRMQRFYWMGEAPNPLHLRDVGINLIYKLFPEKKIPASENNFLYPQENDFYSIREKLKKAGATLDESEILIACHVGCSKASKRAMQFWKRKIASHRTWPFENFYELTNQFQKTHPQIKWVMTGTQGEQKIIKKVFKTRENLIDLTAQTTVLELAALMRFCKVFLSGDTGPMHVAGTTSIPMVSLFGSTHPDVTGPRPLRDSMIFLRGKTISDISVDAVKNAILKLLKN